MNRRAALGAVAGALALGRTGPALAEVRMAGVPRQGGVVIGRAGPDAQLALDGTVVGRASPGGLFVIGFDRDAPPRTTLSVFAGGAWSTTLLDVAATAYEVQRIDGLPPQMVTPTDPEILAREAREYALKEAAFASRVPSEDFASGFILPLERPVRTSPFGVQRVLNGEPKTPHYGVDLAAPEGTPIRAPAAGVVVLAEPDLYLDGGLTLIDHGQGLISAYLHQSRLLVQVGRRLAQGDVIGEVGRRGRATGPHLCWRLKWRGRNLDASTLIGVAAPPA